MKRGMVLVAAAIVTVMLASCVGSDRWRDEKGTGRKVMLPAGEVREGWYFAGGDEVVIEGTVNGDAYVAGGSVEINGTINGDLLVAGGSVIVNGTVTDDVRAAGGMVRFGGKVGKNVSVAGGTVITDRTSAIGGGLMAAAGDVRHGGTIAHDALFAVGSATVSGTIEGSLSVSADEIRVLSGAKVGRDLRAVLKSKEEAEIAGGTVLGRVSIELRETRPTVTILGYTPFRFFVKVVFVGSLLLTGLVFFLLLRDKFILFGSTIRRKAGLSAVWGILGLIIAPVVMLLLLITLIGIPLALLLLALYVSFMYLSHLGVGIMAGEMIFRTEGKTGWKVYGAFVVGVLIFQVLTVVPYLGFLVELAALILGFGALALMVKNYFQSRRAE